MRNIYQYNEKGKTVCQKATVRETTLVALNLYST